MSRSIGLLLLDHSLPSWAPYGRTANLLLLLCSGLAPGLIGCENSQQVAVRVSIPDADSIEAPAAGVGVVALPYDRDNVVASLEARARTPRPHTVTLDSMFARFRGPFTAYTTISYTESQLRDSVRLLQKGLDSLRDTSAGYAALSSRHRQLSDSLARTSSRARAARTRLDRARAEFVSRSESLRSAVRHWEDSTYRGWDSLVDSLTRARRQQAVTDTTDATGWAHFTLAPGTWWIYARAWDTSDPNSQWYWNTPARGDTILLSSRSGQRRPLY